MRCLRYPAVGKQDEPDLVLNNHATKHAVSALRTLCTVGLTVGLVVFPPNRIQYICWQEALDGLIHTVDCYPLAPSLAQVLDWCLQQGTAPGDSGAWLR
jgi:hypothetical protein